MVRSPLIIGHRGAAAKAPENTIAAFRMAIDAGADGIEFDVRLTRDGLPVVIHDHNLKRTGGSPQRIAELSLAELKGIDVGSWFDAESFGHEGVPTLEEVFQLFASSEHLLYLEMKCDTGGRDRLAQTCCDFVRRSSLKERVIVESFDLQGIELIKKLDREIKTAALFEPRLRGPFGSGVIDQALAVGADEIALHHRLANQPLVDAAIKSNLQVVVWTVDDTAWLKKAASRGITALMTNDPESFVRRRDIEAHVEIRVE